MAVRDVERGLNPKATNNDARCHMQALNVDLPWGLLHVLCWSPTNHPFEPTSTDTVAHGFLLLVDHTKHVLRVLGVIHGLGLITRTRADKVSRDQSYRLTIRRSDVEMGPGFLRLN